MRQLNKPITNELLYKYVKSYNVKNVKYILENHKDKININYVPHQNNSYETILYDICLWFGNNTDDENYKLLKIMELFVKHGANMNTTVSPVKTNSPFMVTLKLAIEKNIFIPFFKMVELGADLNAVITNYVCYGPRVPTNPLGFFFIPFENKYKKLNWTIIKTLLLNGSSVKPVKDLLDYNLGNIGNTSIQYKTYRVDKVYVNVIYEWETLILLYCVKATNCFFI
jgi:hypothetical protein